MKNILRIELCASLDENPDSFKPSIFSGPMQQGAALLIDHANALAILVERLPQRCRIMAGNQIRNSALGTEKNAQPEKDKNQRLKKKPRP